MNTGSPLTKWTPQGFLPLIWMLQCAGIIPSALHTFSCLSMQQTYNRDHCFLATDEETEIKATKTYVPLLFKVRWKQLHEVIGEHSSPAVELSFPPAYIDAILGDRRAESEKQGKHAPDGSDMPFREIRGSFLEATVHATMVTKTKSAQTRQMGEQKLKCARASGWESKPTAAFRCPELKISFFSPFKYFGIYVFFFVFMLLK